MVCLRESNTMTMICVDLTDYRPELAGSPEKFFRVLDKIKEPENARDGCSLGCHQPVRSWETRFGCSTCECPWKENIQE